MQHQRRGLDCRKSTVKACCAVAFSDNTSPYVHAVPSGTPLGSIEHRAPYAIHGLQMNADNSLLAVGNGPNVDLYSVTLSDDGSVKLLLLHTYYAPLARFDINHVQPAGFSEGQRSVSMLHR